MAKQNEELSFQQLAARWAAWIDNGDEVDSAGVHQPQAVERYQSQLAGLPDGGRIIHRSDVDYPRSLRAWSDAPPFLYILGELSTRAHVAMVGARDTDSEGLRIGTQLAAAISPYVEVVSGGAKGMDAACHRGALQTSRTTVVLPSAIDRMSPASNRPLFAKVLAAGGAIISELPIGTTVRKYHFRRRNQLLAALCSSVIVVRAKTGGGTMMTAQITRKMGKPLYAVPGSPEDLCSLGCLRLIRDGAAEPVWRPEHVVEKYQAPAQISMFEHPVLSHLRSRGLSRFSLEDLAGIENRFSALVELEARGAIRPTSQHGEWVICGND